MAIRPPDHSSFLELCRARHSLRRFADRPVEREKIEYCLEAARLAPSASNSQSWRFVVVNDPARKEQLCQAVFRGVYATSRQFAVAPVIVALLVKGDFGIRLFGRMQGVNLQVVDAGIAGEHFALAAAEQGLGTCWIGFYDRPGLLDFLKVRGRNYTSVALLALGYPPDGHSVPAKKRKELQEVAGWNQMP